MPEDGNDDEDGNANRRRSELTRPEAVPGRCFARGSQLGVASAQRRRSRRGAAAAPSAAPDAPAAVRSARYLLGPRLGSGGMAEVFLGSVVGAEGFTRPVALKRVRPELERDPRFAEMLIKEARLGARMSHPNLVSVLDLDRDPEDRLLLVLEHVDGVDLARLIESGPLPHPAAIFIVKEMLSGLAYTHGLSDGLRMQGVVHRDVSPHNVLVSWDGAVKIADFGVARVLEAGGTKASIVPRGKTGYMSPEQLAGEPLDGRSDLYAAGVVLWELLAGRRLFAEAATWQLQLEALPRPSAFREDVPSDAEQVAMRLLARDRSERYRTAGRAAAHLARAVEASGFGRDELARLVTKRFPRTEGPHERASCAAIGVGHRTATASSAPLEPGDGDRPGRSGEVVQWRPYASRRAALTPVAAIIVALAVAVLGLLVAR